jgi:hypothetical protein
MLPIVLSLALLLYVLAFGALRYYDISAACMEIAVPDCVDWAVLWPIVGLVVKGVLSGCSFYLVGKDALWWKDDTNHHSTPIEEKKRQ